MASIDDWRAAADQLSNQKKNDYINSNQYILDSINQQKNAELQGLANSNTSALNTLNQNKGTVQQTALDNAKQANINRLLAMKDNKSAMSRAGLNSQGIVGSQVNSINNNYGTNLNTILKDKAVGIRDIENQINNTNLQYETNKSTLAAQYASTFANKQSEIQSTALQYGQEAYNNYIAQQQAAAQLELQRQQQEEANRIAWAQLKASQSQSSNYSFNSTAPQTIKTKYWNGEINSDTQYGTFGTTDMNGVRYQPDNIKGEKLKSSGKTVGQLMKDKNFKNSSGVNVANQKAWKLGNGYYVWNGSRNEYERIK